MDRAKQRAAATTTAWQAYATHSRQPWTSLVFVLPMLAVYEVGTLAFGQVALRNGADAWLRTLLGAGGFGHYFLLPVLVCGILLAWHYVSRAPWEVKGSVIGLMWVESLLLSWLLILLAQVQGNLFGAIAAHSAHQAPLANLNSELSSRMIGYLGAGIYEELLFRLMLLPATIALLKVCGATPQASIIGGIILTSLAFSAAHYQLDFTLGPWQITTPHGDVWNLYSFTFRTLAGVFFAVLFQWRGFGIAAGTHALYDIAVALW